MKVDTQALAAQVLRLSNKLIFLEKKSILHRGKLKLYPSEIHLLHVVSQNAEMNASEMANLLGITKGAVSQTLARLEKKGILYKTKDPYNKNQLRVHFTPLGEAVQEQHRKFRGSIEKQYVEYFSTLSQEERVVIMGFLKKLEIFYDTL